MIHIEDLSVEEFIEAVRNLNEYDITEKVDGFNIRFGFDGDGFYTKGKNDIPKRMASEYGNEFRYSGFKSAHIALSHILPNLLKTNLMKIGDEIEAEVLYGSMPNTVPYSGDINKLIFLKKTKGDPRIREIKEELDGLHVTISITVPKTTDGKTITNTPEEHTWLFSETRRVEPIIVKRIQDDLELDRLLNEIEAFLVKDSGVAKFSNAELISIPLNKRHKSVDPEAWKSLKLEIKEKRKAVRDHVMGHKLNIKSKLLIDLVRKIESGFGPEIEDGGWIEGLVLRNDDRIFKIVDKDMFTALNQFNWEVRNKIGGSPKGIKKVDSIVGKIKVALASVVGHPELGTSQRNRYLASNNITKRSLANDIKDFHKTKEAFIRILEKGSQLLSKYHVVYERLKSNSAVEIEGLKRKFKINPALDEKNLEAFAELYALLATLETKAYAAKTRKDLVELLIDPNTKIKEAARGAMQLTELFDTKPAKFTSHVNDLNHTVNYEFKVGDKIYKVIFTSFTPRDRPSWWSVLYGIKHKSEHSKGYYINYAPVNTGNAGVVFSTLIEIFKDFEKNYYKPGDDVVFSGETYNGLAQFYNRLIPYLAKRLNFDFEKTVASWPGSDGPDGQGNVVFTLRRAKLDENNDEEHEKAKERTGFWGNQGAGVLPIAMDTGRVLIPRRSLLVLQPRTWGVWGGAIDSGEDPLEAALREFKEETEYTGKIIKTQHIHKYQKNNFKYNTFVIYVPTEFEPVLNWETSKAEWFDIGKWPTPLHFGLAEIINKRKI